MSEELNKSDLPEMPAQVIVDEVEVLKVKENVIPTSPSPSPSPSMSEKKKFFYTKKVCKFCTHQMEEKALDYKNVDLLRRFVMPSGKILPRRISGNCAKHQRMAVREVKKARIIAFLPFLDR